MFSTVRGGAPLHSSMFCSSAHAFIRTAVTGALLALAPACDGTRPGVAPGIDVPSSADATVDVADNASEDVAPALETPIVDDVPAVDIELHDPLALTLDALCEPIVASTCRFHIGCRAGARRDAFAACEEHVRAICEDERPRLQARIDAGSLSYDGRAAKVCVTRLEMVACGSLDTLFEAVGRDCDGVFTGRLQDGAVCDDAGDCAPGLACNAGPAGECPGRCARLNPVGAPCDAELAPCEVGASCEAGRCEPRSVALGGHCVATAQCPAGAFCEDNALLGDAVCAPKHATNAKCQDDDACQDSDYCSVFRLDESFALGDTGVCAPRLGFGVACDPFDDSNSCIAGHACDAATESCARIPIQGGEPCVEADTPCTEGSGLVCDAATATCKLEPFIGEACDPAGDGCRFGRCEAAPHASGLGSCRAFLVPGDACGDSLACGGLACSDGICQRGPGRCHAQVRDVNLGYRFRIRQGAP